MFAFSASNQQGPKKLKPCIRRQLKGTCSGKALNNNNGNSLTPKSLGTQAQRANKLKSLSMISQTETHKSPQGREGPRGLKVEMQFKKKNSVSYAFSITQKENLLH